MPNTYTKIASVSLGSAAATISFTSIPSTYTDLLLLGSLRNSAVDTNTDSVLTFNSNTSNYSARRLAGTGTAAESSTQGATNGYYWALTGEGTSWTANTFSNGSIYIPNYTSSNNKSISTDAVAENNGTAASAQLVAGLWSNSAAITSITLTSGSGNYVQYSTATLYGISKS